MSKNELSLVIFFADITGSTTMYEKFGDHVAQQMVSDCLKVMISIVDKSGGSLIQTVGDEVMARFPTADTAFQAAVELQSAHQTSPVKIRVGFHFGSVIEKDGDYFGNVVNVAARMASRATANEIMTTEQTVELLSPANRQNVRYLSTATVKGKDELLSIFEVLWEEEPEEDLTIMAGFPMGPDDRQAHELTLLYQGRTYQIDSANPRLSIGRSDENNLVVSHAQASRKHAKIELSNSKFMLTDMSSNGTFITLTSSQHTQLNRESLELVGDGQIGIGIRHEENAVDMIEFRHTS